MFIELLGIVASLFVISAFICKDVKKIRILDSVGAVLYIVYGILIHSFANILLNSFLIIVQIYHLHKLRKEKEIEEEFEDN